MKRKRLKLNGHPIDKELINPIGKGRNSRPATAKTLERIKGNQHHQIMVNGYKPEYAKMVAEMVLNGAVERDMIVALQTTRTAFRSWQTMYPEFAAALSIASDASLADAKVERAVYEMAVGYTQPAVKILTANGEVQKVRYTEHVGKNINAAKFWLANRRPDKWGKDPEKDGKSAGLPSVTNINMIRGLDSDQLKNTLSVLQGILTPTQGMKRLDNVTDVEPEEEK